jgi:uncharacterized protein YcgL (UPF0745 family)
LIVQNLKVWVYKGARRAETYLYVSEENDFQRVPKDLIDALGKLELVMELELDEQRKLARVDAKEVIKNVLDAGYFLQLAPQESEGKLKLP